MIAQVARVATARRRVKRAAGLLREAAADLGAALSDAPDTLGVVQVVDADTAHAACDLIRVAHGRHGPVDVIVLARPSDDG